MGGGDVSHGCCGSGDEGVGSGLMLANNNVPPRVKQPILLEFKDIRCTVTGVNWRKMRLERRQILHGVEGCFRPGEFTAIMGPSGAGKTTLLNILAGYTTRNSCGTITLNGVTCSGAGGRSCARYIRQQDELRAYLTVHEAMTYAASLKLSHLSKIRRTEKAYEVLSLLGLVACSGTQTRSLSGGQRRRLAVALELLSDPQLLFLDEPTTGLDSSSSTQLISLLLELARGGRTIVATLHQPSALMLSRLNAVHCLAAGRTLYAGPPADLAPALAAADLRCPTFHNPADFLMEVASGEHDVDLIQVADIVNKYVPTTAKELITININDPVPAIPYDEDIPLKTFSENGLDVREQQQKAYVKENLQAGLWAQTWILLCRNLLMSTRSYSLYLWRLAAHGVIALLFGYLYSGVGNDANRVLANYVYLYGSMLLVVYTGKMAVTLSFPLEMEILRGEHFNRWYKLGPYLVSLLAVELPFQILCCVVYVCVSYWLTGNPMEASRLLLVLGAVTATSLCAQAWGYFIGSTTPVKIAVFLGPIIAVLFSVFGFCITLSETPRAFRWLHHLSYFRAGFHVEVATVYGNNRSKLACVDTHSSDNDGRLTPKYCHYISPRKFLNEMDIVDIDVVDNMSLVLGTTIAMYALTALALWWKLSKR